MGKEHQEVCDALHPSKYSYKWFDNNELRNAMRNAIIIRMFSHAPYFVSCASEAKVYQEFLDSVLARTVVPFPTRHRSILDMVAAAAQMCSNDVGIRENLIAEFVVNK